MEYPKSTEFGCDMEDFDVEKYWKKQAEIYNAQHAKEMKEELAKLNKIADEQSYKYLINKYFNLLVEIAGLEKDVIYYAKMPYSENYIAITIYKSGRFFIRGYKYKDNFPRIGEIDPIPFKLDNEEKLLCLMSFYRKKKYSKCSSKKL